MEALHERSERCEHEDGNPRQVSAEALAPVLKTDSCSEEGHAIERCRHAGREDWGHAHRPSDGVETEPADCEDGH
jgi:hypothetical protein